MGGTRLLWQGPAISIGNKFIPRAFLVGLKYAPWLSIQHNGSLAVREFSPLQHCVHGLVYGMCSY